MVFGAYYILPYRRIVIIMDNRIQPASFTNAPFISHESAARPGISSAEDKKEIQHDDSVSISAGNASGDKAGKMIKVNILPQDPQVSPPVTTDFAQEKIGASLSNDKLAVSDGSNPKAIPDLEGNYLYNVGTPQFDQVNAFCLVQKGFDMAEKYSGKPVKYAFGGKLTVKPHKQEGKNAYYSRNEKSCNFFYFQSPSLNKTVQTSESSDIVIHEAAGHCKLDGDRPGWLGWDAETMSVHEGYSDYQAMMMALQDDSSLKLIFQQNGGDFKKESLISRLGEEFGITIHKENTNPNDDDRQYLRSLLNDYKYSDPNTLPDSNDHDVLTGEVHSFSRVLSGALYDILGSLYAKNVAGGAQQMEALTAARDTIGPMVEKSIDLAPQSKCKYKDIALGMIKADRLQNGGKNEKELTDIFKERNILSDGDVDALNTHMSALPSIRMKKMPSTAQEIQKFLETYGDSLGIPDGISMQLRDISSGKNGVTINLDFSQEMDLDGNEYGKYNGHCVDVNGGLTLAFDKKGRLVDSVFDEITDAKKNDVKKGVLDCIGKDLIMEEDSNIFKTDSDIYQGVVVNTNAGRKKIMRIPVIS